MAAALSSRFLNTVRSSIWASACLAGDSAAYQRTSLYGDDVVIVVAHRTALCKSKCGNFKNTYLDDLLAHVLRVIGEPVYNNQYLRTPPSTLTPHGSSKVSFFTTLY